MTVTPEREAGTPASVEARAPLRSDTAGRAFADILDRLDAMPDARFHVVRRTVGGIAFTFRFTDPGLAGLYADRLHDDGAPEDSSPRRIDIVETAALGWPPLLWHKAGGLPPAFEAALLACGLQAEYPHHPGHWSIHDRRAGRAVQIARRADDLPVWHAGAPLRLQLNWAFAERRRHIMHAATLGLGGNGILLVGTGGAGKSGTTLAGIAHGLTTVGDDYVLIDQRDLPMARPVYRLMKQDPAGVARIAGLADRLGHLPRNWQGKYEFDPLAVFPGAMVPALRLRAVVAPAVAHAPASRLDPIAPHEAVRLLAHSTVELLPGVGRATNMQVVALVSRLPCYRLTLSEDPADIAGVLRRLIGKLAA